MTARPPSRPETAVPPKSACEIPGAGTPSFQAESSLLETRRSGLPQSPGKTEGIGVRELEFRSDIKYLSRGGGDSHPRTGLHPDFPGNRENNRENHKIFGLLAWRSARTAWVFRRLGPISLLTRNRELISSNRVASDEFREPIRPAADQALRLFGVENVLRSSLALCGSGRTCGDRTSRPICARWLASLRWQLVLRRLGSGLFFLMTVPLLKSPPIIRRHGQGSAESRTRVKEKVGLRPCLVISAGST
jgi:hypothetical protein